jgi:hypothetical protein
VEWGKRLLGNLNTYVKLILKLYINGMHGCELDSFPPE